MNKNNENNLDLILKENKELKERIFLLEEEFKKYANDTNIRLSELEDIEVLTNKVCRCMGNKINRS
ncbi:hypothetical protein [Spiroplasma endosymbiont of Polydrusus cervinus]|uniref:hypothetical protein n=1 Tax=Spiroplasma endosymbiont of Polydrusus cervinus TaxID=3066287 RepID=UPI0030CBDE0B